jgi:hypothetical protein
MSDEIHELSIDELDPVSGGHGGQMSTTTVIPWLHTELRYLIWVFQRTNGSKGGTPLPGF